MVCLLNKLCMRTSADDCLLQDFSVHHYCFSDLFNNCAVCVHCFYIARTRTYTDLRVQLLQEQYQPFPRTSVWHGYEEEE